MTAREQPELVSEWNDNADTTVTMSKPPSISTTKIPSGPGSSRLIVAIKTGPLWVGISRIAAIHGSQLRNDMRAQLLLDIRQIWGPMGDCLYDKVDRCMGL